MDMETLDARQTMKIYADKVFGFETALKLLKHGFKVHRKGWNGTGMYMFYQRGYPDGIPINKNTAEATGVSEGTVCLFPPYLMMKTASVVTEFIPWIPSQGDLLAHDWALSF